MTDQAQAKLTPKQQVFVEEYLTSWNATDAARRAGYAEPNVQGSRLLTYVSIQAAVKTRMAEKAMKADESLARLAEQARINIADFVSEITETVFDRDGNPHEVRQIVLNWDEIKRRGHLVKSIKSTPSGPALELYDGQTALIQIGKAHGLFIDKVAPTDPTGQKEFGDGYRQLLLGKLTRAIDAGAANNIPEEPEQ